MAVAASNDATLSMLAGMSVASPLGLARLALPLAASSGLGFFLHYVNRTVLSWHSPEALAASLPAGMLAWTFQGFFLMSCSYLGVFAAQHTAAGERREAGAMAWPMLILSACAGVFSIGMIFLRQPLSALFGTAPGVERDMAELLGWYLAETGFIAAAGGLAGFAGGIGRTSLVLILSVLGALMSILLNAWLVLGGLGLPALGVTGAGIATLATAMFSLACWLTWFFARTQREQFFTWAMRNADAGRIRRFCVYALPKGGTEILEMVAFIAFTAVVTRLGTEALAASNLAFNTYLVLMVPMIGFCQGVGIAVGQCVGAGQVDEARRAVRSGLLLALPYLMLMSLSFVLMPGVLLAPARHGDDGAWDAMVALAIPVMACLAVLAPADGLQFLWRFAIQGAGDTRWPLFVIVSMAVVLLALPTWLMASSLPDPRSALIACYGLLAGYTILLAGVMAWRYYRGPWSTMSVREVTAATPG